MTKYTHVPLSVSYATAARLKKGEECFVILGFSAKVNPSLAAHIRGSLTKGVKKSSCDGH